MEASLHVNPIIRGAEKEHDEQYENEATKKEVLI